MTPSLSQLFRERLLMTMITTSLPTRRLVLPLFQPPHHPLLLRQPPSRPPLRTVCTKTISPLHPKAPEQAIPSAVCSLRCHSSLASPSFRPSFRPASLLKRTQELLGQINLHLDPTRSLRAMARIRPSFPARISSLPRWLSLLRRSVVQALVAHRLVRDPRIPLSAILTMPSMIPHRAARTTTDEKCTSADLNLFSCIIHLSCIRCNRTNIIDYHERTLPRKSLLLSLRRRRVANHVYLRQLTYLY